MDTVETLNQRQVSGKKAQNKYRISNVGIWYEGITSDTVNWNSRRKGETVWGRSKI